MKATLSCAGVEVAAATDIGPRRQTNADAYLVDDGAGFLALADGMGDTQRSAEVARAALDAVAEVFQQPWSVLPFGERSTGEAAERLWLGMVQANGRLYVPGRAGLRRTGTTFVGAVLCPRRVCIAHVGDSRGYLIRKGTERALRLTRDDTVLDEAIARGVPRQVAASLYDAHALTRAIGLQPSIDRRPSLYPWEEGDTLVLCSDGISNDLPSSQIAASVLEHTDVERVAEALIIRAMMAGNRDNATVVIARRLHSRSGET